MTKSSPSKWSPWVLLVSVAVLLLMLLSSFYLWQLFSSPRLVEEARERLRAEGAPMTFRELAVGPPVPDEENAALVLIALESYFTRTALEEFIDTFSDWDYENENHPGMLAPWTELSEEERQQLTQLLDSKDVRHILAEVHRALALPGMDRQVDPENYELNLGPMYFQRVVSLYLLKANQSLFLAGKADSAEAREALVKQGYSSLLEALELTDRVTEDSSFVTFIDALSKVGFGRMTLEAVQNADRGFPLPRVLFPRFVALLTDSEINSLWTRILDQERFFMEKAIDICSVQERVELAVSYPFDSDAPWAEYVEKAYVYWALPSFYRYYAAWYDSLRELRKANLMDPAWADESQTILCQYFDKTAEDFGSEDLDGLFSTYMKVGNHLQADWSLRQVVACGLAINAYADDRGQLPSSLEALVPDYLPEVPVDPLSPKGGTIRYEPLGDHFRLWAVGLNGIDDSGLHAENWQEGDLVFRGRRAVFDEL
ncbi:hypothetical protein H5P28_14805 [Ruficoccus amylovorans]|uniref:Uncharacterized protein n=1 Tax=Ruficoccus amylovorans TaxID=1804625 RepID=A0A842HIW1_9BACT|nr:hypothetical protein [Ruficoccus amylovorans]MBC2595534.1 hypothetical protein [Ruficoccus amylovorans]